MVPGVAEDVSWVTNCSVRSLPNAMRNGPPGVPNTPTLPRRAGIEFKCVSTWAAVGETLAVKVSGATGLPKDVAREAATPLCDSVNVPPGVPPSVSVCSALPVPSNPARSD